MGHFLDDYFLALAERLSIQEKGELNMSKSINLGTMQYAAIALAVITAVIHLALATPAEFDRATWDCSQHHSVLTATGGYTKENGRAAVSERPGLGIEPVMDVLGEPIAAY